MEIQFDIQKDFRQFKEGTKYTINPQFGKILYITGKNRSGKSTLLQILRSKKDSLRSINKQEFDGMYDDRIELAGLEPCEVTGYDYDEVFFLDSIIDDPASMMNSASAYAFINGGGYASRSQSKGEKALIMIHKFRMKIERYLKDTYGSVDEWRKSNKRCLIVLDEADEGFDVNLQLNWNYILLRKFINEYRADLIVVSHNPLCMMSPLPELYRKGVLIETYDIETKLTMTPGEYFQQETGYSINIEPVAQI